MAVPSPEYAAAPACRRHPALRAIPTLVAVSLLCSCGASTKTFDPSRKFSPRALQQDYQLFRRLLETRHPSLYWYHPKPVIDSAFQAARGQLTDSLTAYEFRKVLQPVVALIDCGHTSVRVSRAYEKYLDQARVPTSFPFQVKIWNDTVAFVRATQKGVRLQRGDLIESINHRPVGFLLDSMRRYIPADGGNRVAKNQLLSFGTNFGSFYSALFGWEMQYDLSYRDHRGVLRQTTITPAPRAPDTAPQKKRPALAKKKKIPRQQRLRQQRHFEIRDGYGLMQLNSFSDKLQLKRFFRQAFQTMESQQVSHLVIDLRLNGGGRLSHFISLIRYLIDHPYRVCDSLYAISRSLQDGRYMDNHFLTWLQLQTTTKKRQGNYHYRYFENHFYKPRKRHHFKGRIYLLSSGYTASASTLTLSALKGQANVQIVGEPSGGAAYGATAWIIPDVTMPHTRVRFRLPLFRMVIDASLPQDGQGVIPDVWAGPSLDAIRSGEDFKMKRVLELIRSDQQTPSGSK